jgi:hypothetical protein
MKQYIIDIGISLADMLVELFKSIDDMTHNDKMGSFEVIKKITVKNSYYKEVCEYVEKCLKLTQVTQKQSKKYSNSIVETGICYRIDKQEKTTDFYIVMNHNTRPDKLVNPFKATDSE